MRPLFFSFSSQTTEVELRMLQRRKGRKIKGNIVGDGRYGSTSLSTERPLITNDQLLKDAVNELGGDAR